LPLNHPLAAGASLCNEELTGELLVLAEGRCLANQALWALE
jgi:hypothetical protein